MKNQIQINQAVILAGGKGERLRPLTENLPKPMAPVNGRPFLDYLLHSLVQVGIEKIIFLVGYKAEVLIDRYRRLKGLDVSFSIGKVEDQTGRRLLDAYDLLDDYFLLMYGDNYWIPELRQMKENYKNARSSLSTTVFSNSMGTGEYGFENNVIVRENKVLKYDKRREDRNANGVDIGYFLIKKIALDSTISTNISFEEDLLPKFIEKKDLSAYVTDNQYYYITNLESLEDFQSVCTKNNFNPLPENYFGEFTSR